MSAHRYVYTFDLQATYLPITPPLPIISSQSTDLSFLCFWRRAYTRIKWVTLRTFGRGKCAEYQWNRCRRSAHSLLLKNRAIFKHKWTPQLILHLSVPFHRLNGPAMESLFRIRLQATPWRVSLALIRVPDYQTSKSASAGGNTDQTAFNRSALVRPGGCWLINLPAL